ncbi:hypothetical protein [Microbacterium sp. PRC9]|uniref:hypothetical protein n=1 Tax=Microbacterium sp. PRC9 TaxID=2962591 RepID=UPI002881D665|nr:hypothetical protein [Microbacterium sp. PRC9]MDT0142790.1 hypothetical protein [Microbacterium sp. PRC9]
MTDSTENTSDRLIEESQPVVIDAGTLEFSAEDLTATGLLIPFGVKSRSNLGEFTFASGDVVLPSDLTGMSLNVEHKREDVVGAFSKVWEQPEGVMATFKYADTDAGRKAFEEGKSGKRKNLSAEVAKVRIRDGKALPGAALFAAAQVEKPAFEGATLLAAEDTPDTVSATETSITWSTREVSEAIKTAVQEALAAFQNSPAEEAEVTEPPANPAEESINTDEEPVMATENEAGAVPATLLAGAAPVKKAQDVDLGTVFAAMSAVKNSGSQEAETLLAALADIKVEASGGLTTAGSGVIPATFTGKLWQGKRYQQKYISLLNHQFGGINIAGRKGFKIAQGTALVSEVANAGQKVELPTGTATTSLVSSTLRKFGFAADYALEFQYLDGGEAVLQAFFEGVVDSGAKVIDEAALSTIFTVASKTTTALDRLVAPGTYPTQYTAAMGQLIQGIDLVSDNGDDATFAIVNPFAWNQLLYTPKDLVPEFVEFGVGIGTGEATAGKVRVVKAPASFFTGLGAGKPQVIVGAKNAIEFREQHVEIDALEVAKFGVDRAMVAFLETFIVRPESVSIIGAV